MSKEDRAFSALALIRDRLVVFNGVQAAAFNENLTADEALESIRAYYDAFDADHPDAVTNKREEPV